MRRDYVHGYETAEGHRLHDQARTLQALLHHDTAFPDGSAVLEAGSGVGAHTVSLIRGSPGARITCVDTSAASLAEAEVRILAAGLPVPVLRRADVRALPFADASFDHAVVCFVLEHLPDPEAALAELRRVLRGGGTLTVIEGDHGSTLFHPDDAAARAAIACQVELQRASGGDASIGRRLRPPLSGAGLRGVRVSPRLVHVDASRPELVEGFTRRTFTARVAGVRDEAIRSGLAGRPPSMPVSARCFARRSRTGWSATPSSRPWASRPWASRPRASSPRTWRPRAGNPDGAAPARAQAGARLGPGPASRPGHQRGRRAGPDGAGPPMLPGPGSATP